MFVRGHSIIVSLLLGFYLFTYLLTQDLISYYIALASIEVTMYTRLSLDSQRSACICLPSLTPRTELKVCAITPGLFLIFKNLLFVLLCMCVAVLNVCMSLCVCMAGTHRYQEKAFESFDLQTVVGCHVDAGNRTWVLWMSCQWSYLPSHLSSTHSY